MKLIYIVLSLLMVLNLEASQESVNATYKKLDKLAVDAGTDKSSLFHNYTKVYAKLFDELQDKPIKFLEIGIYKGSSVKMWEGFFVNGDLHFIDKTNEYLEYYTNKSKFFFLDQASERDLQKFIQEVGGDFDVIIDDGGHTMQQQITSFNVLFPYVKSGGIYVIEDLATSYWKAYGGLGSLERPRASRYSTTEMLKRLIDDLNYYTARKAIAGFDNLEASFKESLTPYQKSIESITFYPNLCILIKR